ncbi:MAG: exopolyphosphatase [Flavobacteriales bacterium]|nr:MAG: exopolyphosphatase [Flavobacteriales bacterium]
MKFSAIDIGTNAARLLVGEVVKESNKSFVKKISYTRIPLRLGDDAFSLGRIDVKKKSNLINTIKAFQIISDIFEVNKMRAVATSAMRNAENGSQIVQDIRQGFGIDLEIISGEEEANLILGTFMLLDIAKGQPFVVIDVGGGSTEINIYRGNQKIASQSFKIGTIRMLKGKVKKGIWVELNSWISNFINTSESFMIFGTGGNINKTHKLLGVKSENPIPIQEMTALKEKLKALTLEERMKRYQIRPDRADVIVPALEIYTRILSNFKSSNIFVPKIGLSDGMIYQMYLEENKI